MRSASYYFVWWNKKTKEPELSVKKSNGWVIGAICFNIFDNLHICCDLELMSYLKRLRWGSQYMHKPVFISKSSTLLVKSCD